MASISVLVVDDHQVFADALRTRLESEPDLWPVSVAYSVREARLRLDRSPFDVAVIDYKLGDGTGTALAEYIRQSHPATCGIILSAVQTVSSVVDALAAGMRAWLPKTVDTRHLVRVIHGVCRGEIWLDPALLGRVLPALLVHTRARERDPLDALTTREREVLDCMIEGLGRAQIAARLRVSDNTVRTHRQNLTRKLGAHSALEAVTLALRSSSAHARAI